MNRRNQRQPVPRAINRSNRRGQTILEYAILVAAMLLGTAVAVVLLNKKIADLIGYSIDVTTYDASTNTSLNSSVENEMLLPTRTNEDGETVMDGPTTLGEATGIEDIGELIETERP